MARTYVVGDRAVESRAFDGMRGRDEHLGTAVLPAAGVVSEPGRTGGGELGAAPAGGRVEAGTSPTEAASSGPGLLGLALAPLGRLAQRPDPGAARDRRPLAPGRAFDSTGAGSHKLRILDDRPLNRKFVL